MSTISKPMANVAIQLAKPHDLKTLVRLIRGYYAFDHIAFDEKVIRAGLKAMFKDDSTGLAFLIIVEAEPVGYAILTYGFDLEFGGRTALMTDLFLEPNHRGQGIGRKTLQFLELFCRKNGIGALELQVERTNKAAQRFYRRLKFDAHDRIPMIKHL